MAETDKTHKTDNTQKTDKTEAERPKLFLYLSGAAMGVAVLSYILEQTIYDLTGSVNAFLYVLVISVVLSLLFLAAYRFRKLGRWVLGYGPEDITRERAKPLSHWSLGGMADSGVETKRLASRRKSHRHERREIARAAGKLRKSKVAETGSSDNSTKSNEDQ